MFYIDLLTEIKTIVLFLHYKYARTCTQNLSLNRELNLRPRLNERDRRSRLQNTSPTIPTALTGSYQMIFDIKYISIHFEVHCCKYRTYFLLKYNLCVVNEATKRTWKSSKIIYYV